MTAGMIGLAIGLAFGVANYVMLRKLAQRVDMPETKKTLNVVAALDLVLMPLAGWAIGAYIYPSGFEALSP